MLQAKFDRYGREVVYCSCGTYLGYRVQGIFTQAGTSSVILNNVRYCSRCADDARNAQEMGYNAPTMPAAGTVRKWEELPVAGDEQGRKYIQDTFLTKLGQAQVIDPEWAVNIIIGHGLATADINRWLDTLNNTDAAPVERERARLLLAQNADEYRWMCEKRELVSEKIQGPKHSDVKVTWRLGL